MEVTTTCTWIRISAFTSSTTTTTKPSTPVVDQDEVDLGDQGERIESGVQAVGLPVALAAPPDVAAPPLKSGNAKKKFANDPALIALAEAMIRIGAEIGDVAAAEDQTDEVVPGAQGLDQPNPHSFWRMMEKTDR